MCVLFENGSRGMNVIVLLPGWVLFSAALQQPWEANSYVHI